MKIDSNTTVKELKDLVKDFIHKRDWEKYHHPKDIAESICIEAAELLEIFQWRSIEEISKWKNDQKRKIRVSEELADIILYSLSMFDVMEIDLSKAIMDKIEKNERKYPIDTYRGKAYIE